MRPSKVQPEFYRLRANLGIGNPKPFGNDRGFPVTEFTLELFALAEKKYAKK